MKNKMKVIDLIDIKEKPKHIKVNNVDFYLNELSCDFRNLYLDENSKNWYNDYLLVFNENIEIIEEVEKPKEIDTIPLNFDNHKEQIEVNEYLRCMINKTIEAINYLLKKESKQ